MKQQTIQKFIILAVAVFVCGATFWNATNVAKAAMVMNRTVTQATSTLNWGLVRHWTFDAKDSNAGSFFDKIAGANNFIKPAGVSTAAGVVSQATGVLGSATVIPYANTSNIASDLPYTTGTVSFWVKVPALDPNSEQVPFFVGDKDANYENELFVSLATYTDSSYTTPCGGTNSFYIKLTAGGSSPPKWQKCTEANTALAAVGKWAHVAVVQDGTGDGGIKFYLNGTQIALNQISGTNYTYWFNDLGSADRIAVGSIARSSACCQLKGQVDDLRIYSRALSAAEILQLYNLGAQKQATTMNTNFAQATSTLNWGLVGHWTMDGKDCGPTYCLDKNPSAVKNIGDRVGGTLAVPGKIGQALKFNGTSSFLSGGSGSSLALTTAGSISVWFKLTAQPAGTDGVATFALVGKGRDLYGGADGYFLNYILNDAGCPGTYQLRFDAGNTAEGYSANVLCTDLTLNKWYHVVATWSGTSANLYINAGSPTVGTIKTPGGTNYASDRFQIGAGYFEDNNTLAAYTPGMIDDVRVYSRALSVAEVQQLYNQGAQKQAVSMNTNFVQATSTLNWGLKAYWPFDGKDCGPTYCLDKNPNPGTKYNGTKTGTMSVAGKIGQGLKFNGTSDYVDLGAQVIPSGSDWTISAWMKTRDVTNARYFIAQYSGSVDGRLVIGMNRTPGKLDVYQGPVGTVTRVGIITPTATLSANTWYHIVVKATGGDTITTYVNAVEDGSSTGGSNEVQVTNTTIGRYNGLDSDYWDGFVDDVRIYSRALSLAEIQQLYKYGR